MKDKPKKKENTVKHDSVHEALKREGYGFVLRPKQACEALGVSSATLLKLRREGLVQATKHGKDHRYYRESIARYLETGQE